MYLTTESCGVWLIDQAVEKVIARHTAEWAKVQASWAAADAIVEHDERRDREQWTGRFDIDLLTRQQRLAGQVIEVHGSLSQFDQQQINYLQQHRECPCMVCHQARAARMQNMGMAGSLGAALGAGLGGALFGGAAAPS